MASDGVTKDELWNIIAHGSSAFVHVGIAIWIGTDVFNSPELPIYEISQGEPPYESADLRGNVWFKVSPLMLIWVIEIVTAFFEVCYICIIHQGLLWKGKILEFKDWTTNPVRWVEYSITATLGTLSQAIGVGAITRTNFLLFIVCGISMQFTGYITEAVDDFYVSLPALFMGCLIMAVQIAVLTGDDDGDDEVLEDENSPRKCLYLDQTQNTTVSALNGRYYFNDDTGGGTLCLTKGSYTFVDIPDGHPFRIVGDGIAVSPSESSSNAQYFTDTVEYTVSSAFSNAFYECENHEGMRSNITYFFEGCDPYAEKDFNKWNENLAPYFIYYLSFAVNCMTYLFARKKFGAEKIFPIIEFVYALLSVSSKAAIASLVWTTVNQYQEHFAPCNVRRMETRSERAWDIMRWTAMVLPAALASALIIFRIRPRSLWTSPQSASARFMESRFAKYKSIKL